MMRLLDPHRLFLQLLWQVSFDCSLLVDWLISPETCFIAYLTQYLKLLAACPSALHVAAQEWDSKEDACSDNDLCVDAHVFQDSRGSANCIANDSALVNSAHQLNSNACIFSETTHPIENSEKGNGSSGTVHVLEYDCAIVKRMKGDGSPIAEISMKQTSALALIGAYGTGDSEDDDDDDDDNDDEEEEEEEESDNFHSTMSSEDNNEREGTKGWTEPVSSVQRVVSLLSEVGRQMERLFASGLLVYNPKPLVSLIRQCEHSLK
jgi:hypothetical protein